MVTNNTTTDTPIATKNPRVYSAVEKASDEENPPEAAPPAFPRGALPPILRDMAEAICEVTGVPGGMAGPMVLATASAAIGGGLAARTLQGHVTPANLYIIVSKASGSGGSTSYQHAVRPLHEIERRHRAEFDEKKRPVLEAKRERCEARMVAVRKAMGREDGDTLQLERDMEELKREYAQCVLDLIPPQLVTSDATSESMAVLLAANGECMAHFDSDAADALGSILGRYSAARHIADSLWLKAFSREAININRRGGDPIHLLRPSIALLFLITQDKARELFRHSRLAQGGFLARCLICDPKAVPRPIEGDGGDAPALITRDVAARYTAAIEACVEEYRTEREEGEFVVPMDREARARFTEDHNRFCDEYKGETSSAPFDARQTELAMRIAVVLHAFEHVRIDHGDGFDRPCAEAEAHKHTITVGCAESALAIRDWFRHHQRELLASRQLEELDDKWRRTRDLMIERPGGITARDLYEGGRVFPNSALANDALSTWLSEGLIEAREAKPPRAGRPTTRYFLVKRPISRS